MDKDTKKLLTEIQRAILCQYLSDLHSPNMLFDTRAKQLVLEIPDSRYSTVAWSEAVSYITGKSRTYHSVSDVKNIMANR